MPRLMSVTLTKDAVIERRKRVTRRGGWRMLHPGDRLTLCEKVMGRRKGDPLVRLAEVSVVSVRRERLDAVTDDDVMMEGFTEDDWRWSPHFARRERVRWFGTPAEWFVAFYCEHMGGTSDQEVTRVEWRYLDEED